MQGRGLRAAPFALLRSLREAEANGLVQTREEALELLAGLI